MYENGNPPSRWKSASLTHRPGPVRPNEFRICLGSYEASHRAHFTGLLDEVKLYDRALSGAEVQAHYQALNPRALTAPVK